jgi:hypothetical protein
MPKSIVLLSDGTGNSAAKLFKTNVWRIYQAIDLRANQIATYDDGVGTEAFKPLALLGGAIGWGLRRNVLELYTFLCRNYQAGDRIYCFGFSRGAFTIRTLVGLIGSQGIVDAPTEAELRREVRAAYARDREEFSQNWGRLKDGVANLLGRGPAGSGKARGPSIAFLGLWDTVDAYGLPIDELKRGVDYYFRALSFPDQILSERVERACHALALDDERLTFHPVLFDEKQSKRPERIKQVWFAGVHSNVGGGYANDAVAHVSLAWMMAEAQDAGLRFVPGALASVQAIADPHGELYDSRTGLAAYYRYAPRKLSALCNDRYKKVEVKQPKIHESVLVRIKEDRRPYAPTGIPARYDVVRFNGSIVPMDKLMGPAGQPLYESAAGADGRAGTEANTGEQERAWDRIWWRRLLYFLTLIATAFLAGFPWWFPARPDAACSGRWCFFDPLLAVLGGFAPGWLEEWIQAFRLTPGPFVLGAGALFVTLTLSSMAKRGIANAGERAWRELKATQHPPSTPYRPGLVYRVRTSPILLGAYHRLTRSVMPALFALALVVLGFDAVNRGAFEIASSLGLTCRGSAAVRAVGPEPVTVELVTSDPCNATGYTLETGKRYMIELPPAPVPGRDGSIPVDDLRRGFTAWEVFTGDWASGLVMYAASPLKRSFSRNWFQPVVRIGRDGKDQYSLGAGPFRARTGGELFLFVNDAVLGVPNIGPLANVWSRFYPNNRGTLTVTIRRIERPVTAR